MISRERMFDMHSEANGLDDLVRWALCESVAHATPPPHVWARVRERAERRSVWKQAWMWKAADLLWQTVTACLSRLDGLLPIFEIPPMLGYEGIVLGHDVGRVRPLDHHRLSCGWYARLGT